MRIATPAALEASIVRLATRGLWFSAWGLWAWLGVGLYHQLPREPGPAACSLPAGRDIFTLGFLGQSNRFAVIQDMGTNRARIVLYDASNGNLVKELRLPSTTFLMGTAPRNLDDPMVVLGNDIDGKSPVAGISAYDLSTFECKRLSTSPNQFLPVAVDSQRMIALCIDHGTAPKRFVFLDLANGSELMAQEVPEDRSFHGDAFVDASHGFVAFATTTAQARGMIGSKEERTAKLEIWKLDRPPTLAAAAEFSPRELPITASHNGRIAFTKIGSIASFRVFDVAQRQWVFEKQLSNEPKYDPRKPGAANEPIVSQRGRAALDGTWSVLWDLGSGTRLWSKKDHEFVHAERGGSAYLVREDWSKFLPWRSVPIRFETRALRDLESGTLFLRTSSTSISTAFKLNKAQSLVVLNDGTVRRLPFPVNYGLLVLCQGVLALPLVLFWLVLRWRFKRRFRHARHHEATQKRSLGSTELERV